jgi:hypothetical protein
VTEFYEPLLERDLDAIPAAASEFLASHSLEDLWTAVARFAILAYAPSQHAKRVVMAVRAAHELREVMGDGWRDLIVECARYASESRQPWSEPPFLEPPVVDPDQPGTIDELRAAIAAVDRPRAERWLARRVDDAGEDLRAIARGDALLVTDSLLALAPLLGDKGRYALLRVAIWEMLAGNDEAPVTAPLDALIAQTVAKRGSIDSVRNVLLWVASQHTSPSRTGAPLTPYRLSRDYAQTLLAHAAARRLPPLHVDPFLAAVHENLEKGEGYEEWSLA